MVLLSEAAFTARLNKKINKKVIVFDIDDTIADFLNPCIEILNRKLKKTITIQDFKDTFDILRVYNIEFKTLKKILNSELFYHNLGLTTYEVKQWFRVCKVHGYKIHIMSNRLGILDDAKRVTEAWLDSYKIPYDKFIPVPVSESKVNYFDSKVVAIFDDNNKHIDEAKKWKIDNAFLLETVSNSSLVYDKKVKHAEVWKILQGLSYENSPYRKT